MTLFTKYDANKMLLQVLVKEAFVQVVSFPNANPCLSGFIEGLLIYAAVCTYFFLNQYYLKIENLLGHLFPFFIYKI